MSQDISGIHAIGDGGGGKHRHAVVRCFCHKQPVAHAVIGQAFRSLPPGLGNGTDGIVKRCLTEDVVGNAINKVIIGVQVVDEHAAAVVVRHKQPVMIHGIDSDSGGCGQAKAAESVIGSGLCIHRRRRREIHIIVRSELVHGRRTVSDATAQIEYRHAIGRTLRNIQIFRCRVVVDPLRIIQPCLRVCTRLARIGCLSEDVRRIHAVGDAVCEIERDDTFGRELGGKQSFVCRIVRQGVYVLKTRL